MSFASPRRLRSMVKKVKTRVALAYITPKKIVSPSTQVADPNASVKTKRKRRTVRKKSAPKETYNNRRRNLLLLEENRRMEERMAERQRIRTSKKRKEHSQRLKFIDECKKRMSNPYFTTGDTRWAISVGRIRPKTSLLSRTHTGARPKFSKTINRLRKTRPQSAMPRLSASAPILERHRRHTDNDADLTAALNTGLNVILFHHCTATVPLMPHGDRESNGSRREMNVKISDVQSRQSTIGVSITLSTPGESTKHAFIVREMLRDLCDMPDLTPLQGFFESPNGALEPRLHNELKDAFVNSILSRLYIDSITEKLLVSRDKVITKTIPEKRWGWPEPSSSGEIPARLLEPVSHPRVLEPVESDPGVSEPVESDPGVLEGVLKPVESASEPVESHPGVSDPEESDPGVRGPVENDLDVLELVENDPGVLEPAESDPGVLEHVESDPHVLELVEGDPGVLEPAESKQERNPQPGVAFAILHHQLSLLRKSVRPKYKHA